jgi:apurinic endonuclease APN1
VVSRIGLHLRLEDSLVPVATQALELELPFFQSFIGVRAKEGKLFMPSDYEVTQFRKLCDRRFTQLYAHAPFWLNLADPARSSLQGLWNHIMLAQRLGFTHLIVHPGSSVHASKQQGIEMVARTINELFKKEFSLTLVLENTAHGATAVGSDIGDLCAIRALLDKPERVQFCIDTAHAHAYGYEVNSAESMHTFLDSVCATLGADAIGLLHLNDASDHHGSFKDRHALLGTGTVGEAALKATMSYEKFNHIPIIVEPPFMMHDALVNLYSMVQSWE